jgi:sulfatase modifying factor 1
MTGVPALRQASRLLARASPGTIGFAMRRANEMFAMATVAFALAACTSSRSKETEPSDAGATPVPSAMPVPSATQSAVPAPPLVLACPNDMVKVGERLCVDRYESQLVDVASARPLSPYYPVLTDYDTFLEARRSEAAAFLARRTGTAVDVPFPELPAWQRRGRPTPKAVSKPGVVPNAYLTRAVAAGACELAGKRLCSLVEWQTACRGERATKHPYGAEFTNFRCNVFREAHPGHVLFGDASVGMQDPRMGLVEGSRGPLLTPTGGTPTCGSRWGDGVIYDMVGNLDEWVDDAEGTFAGGFFSRATRDGCERIVVAHGPDYRDYTTGARCCRDARP